jgi:hypothetical protein
MGKNIKNALLTILGVILILAGSAYFGILIAIVAGGMILLLAFLAIYNIVRYHRIAP